MLSTIACHPFDVIRVKMQSSALAAAVAAGPATTTPLTPGTFLKGGAVTTAAQQQQPQAQRRPLGLAATVRLTVQQGGFRALYTGLALPLAAQAVYKGTVFTVNNLTESAIIEWRTMTTQQEEDKNNNGSISSPTHKLTMADRFLSGFMGGAVNAALFCSPVEYVRNQQIVHMGEGSSNPDSTGGGRERRRLLGKHSTGGPISVIRGTIRSNGVAGLWRGVVSTVLRDSVGCGLFFVTIAYSQQKLAPQPSSSSLSAAAPVSVIIASGALAGVAYWLWALPIDTAKTWIQSGTASNLTHALQLLSQKDGGGVVRGLPTLFRGWQVAYGRGAPSAAITVVTYSLVMRHLQGQQ